jgi:hypothetical protein
MLVKPRLTWCRTCVLLTLAACLGCSGGSSSSSGGGGGAGGSAGSGGAGGDALPFRGSVTNLDEALRQVDFVFEGEVTAIEYASSTNNGTGGPDPSDSDDSGTLPHTFVTYRIIEDFGGNATEDSVTMRFLGGVDDATGPDYDILDFSEAPRFDVGDRDIVLMRGNTELACPIVGCADGRFRILQSPQDDEPYVFSELGQEVRLVEDSAAVGHLFMVGEHQIPAIFEHTISLPDGSSIELALRYADEGGEVDPAPSGLAPKHSFEPRPDGTAPLDQPAEDVNAPVAGYRLRPEQLRALIRESRANHPDFLWHPPPSPVPSEPFTIGQFADASGPTPDDDPRVPPPVREPYEQAEADAVAAADIENDGSIDPGVIFDIQSRRQTLTGVVETPNEEDEDSRAEDMWTEPAR